MTGCGRAMRYREAEALSWWCDLFLDPLSPFSFTGTTLDDDHEATDAVEQSV